MKLVTFVGENAEPKPGVLHDDRIFDLSSTGVRSVLELIERGSDGLQAAQKAVASGAPGIAAAGAKLLAPITRPPRIFAVGVNYAAHSNESPVKTAAVPTVFFKMSSSVVGPGADIILPKNSTQPDYEVELAVVIGKAGYRVPAVQWKDYVFGYTALNDVSARDVQLATSQWSLGKSFPTFTPLGPVIVTKDEIADPHALNIKLSIDGEELQNSNSSYLIFKIPELIEYISSITPLEAGDIISTGTPAGVGLGRTPQRWLKPGEEVLITIEGIGELRNRTRAEEKSFQTAGA